MRCKNCGWPNNDNTLRCVKCNALLQGSTSNAETGSTPPPHPGITTPDSPKATLREVSSPEQGPYNPEPALGAASPSVCSACGYPVSPTMAECPVCRASLTNGAPRPRPKAQPAPGGFGKRGGTINPWATPAEDSFCTLQRLPWQNERVTYEPVSYSGDSITLNRANTDANNNSITSREQATLSFENGEWYIENRSDLKTTLIRTDRKLMLEDGDIIVLGNRMFEFRKG